MDGRSDFLDGGKLVARVTDFDVQPQRAIVGEHLLFLDVALAFKQSLRVHHIHGELGVRPQTSSSSWALVGHWQPIAPYTPQDVSDTEDEATRWSFRVPLSRTQLHALESETTRKGICFRSHLRLRVEYERRVCTIGTWIDHRIPLSDWLDLVEGLGGCQYILVPLPTVRHGQEVPPALARGLDALKRAREELAAGRRPPEIAKAIRVANDAITELQDDKKLLAGLGGKLDIAAGTESGNLRSATVEERMRLVRFGLQALVAPSTHGDDESARVEYDLPRARAALAIAAAILSTCVDANE